ncbi:MAG: ABC transporter permease [Muribaculaceae bacterium]|nr:ABC transporter permease [Muribaculaceae bacterium]
MILHDLKVATRNLMKYRLQTLISVVSIAIGIVTLSLAHSVLNYFRLPSIYDQPYHDRAYKVQFVSISEGENQRVTEEILRAVKGNGGLRNSEKIAVYNGNDNGVIAEFHLSDSTVRKGQVSALLIDPEYPGYAGMRSAVTGKNIRVLKAGEAIIGEEYAKSVFGESNPLGAVQCKTGKLQTIPVTIVDVYKSQPFIDDKRSNGRIYFCLSDNIEDHMPESYFYASGIRVILKKGSNEQKLLQEIKSRVKPLGLNVKISKVLDDESIKEYFIGRTFVYIISSLILLAAVIGFLRMQIQLFRMRQREIALRIVNGASRIRLFGMLVTETAISILMSVSVAFILSILLQNFMTKRFNNFLYIPVYNIWSDSLIIGFCLLCVCCLIVWIVIKRIGNNDDGLSANMRRGRNHVFRNVMLGIQIFISMVFVCGTFCLANGAAKILDAYNIPENDDFYKKCLYLRPDKAENPERLIDEFRRLTDLEKMAV